MTEKTLHNTNLSQASDNVDDLQAHGGDIFKLLSKASSESERWMKSTKAMEIEGVGCVVQVTTQQGHLQEGPVRKGVKTPVNIIWAVAEAVTFVPNVTIVKEDGIYKLVQAVGNIKLRT